MSTAVKDFRIKYLYPKLDIAAVPRFNIKMLRKIENDISLRAGIWEMKDKEFMLS